MSIKLSGLFILFHNWLCFSCVIYSAITLPEFLLQFTNIKTKFFCVFKIHFNIGFIFWCVVYSAATLLEVSLWFANIKLFCVFKIHFIVGFISWCVIYSELTLPLRDLRFICSLAALCTRAPCSRRSSGEWWPQMDWSRGKSRE